jgi:hypothetical protein
MASVCQEQAVNNTRPGRLNRVQAAERSRESGVPVRGSSYGIKKISPVIIMASHAKPSSVGRTKCH